MDFTLPEPSVMKIVTCNCHVDDSTKGRYDMILGRYILTPLGLNIKLSDHVIKAEDAPLKGLMAPIVDMGIYELKYLTAGNITPKESFMNDYIEEIK